MSSPSPWSRGLAALTLGLVVVAGVEVRAGELLLVGGRVLDPGGTRWIDDAAVHVQDGRIVAVGEAGDIADDVTVVWLDGAHVVPGLIDLHTHLLLHPYDEASWEHQVLKESLELRTVRGVAAARATIEAGFTTIRELGTEGAGYADVALRDAIDAGIIPGPRVLTATRALVPTGCYGPFGFDPRVEVPKGAQVADGVEGVRRAVREQIAAGADWIKVYADYRRAPDAPSTPTYSPAELVAIVDEAASAGIPVAAHASTDEGIRRAIEAGVRTIEHGTGATGGTVELMRERGVVLCPTLAAVEAIATYAGWEGDGPLPARLAQARRTFTRSLMADVAIACGSDAGVFDHGDNVRELELMAQWGMTPAGALRAATVTAAAALGREDLGRIAPGHVADLVVVAGDPLADVSALRGPRLVMRDGNVVVDRRDQPSAAEREELLAFCQRMLDLYGERRLEEVAAMFAPDAVVSFDYVGSDRRGTSSAAAFLGGGEALQDIAEFREWFMAGASVRVDGSMATIWTPYRLEIDGARAVGIDVFQLARLEEGWRIVAVAFTNRPF